MQKNVLSAPSTFVLLLLLLLKQYNTEYYSDTFTHIHIWFVCCFKNEPIRYHSALWWSHVISLQKNLNYIYRERATHAHIQREIKTLTHPRETKQKTNHFIYIWKTCKRYNLHEFVLQSLIDRHTHTTERAQAQTHVNTRTHTNTLWPFVYRFHWEWTREDKKKAKQNTEKYT